MLHVQGQKAISALYEVRKTLREAASGKAAAKRAGRALEKLLKELNSAAGRSGTATPATEATPAGAGANARVSASDGAARAAVAAATTPAPPLKLSPAGSPTKVRPHFLCEKCCSRTIIMCRISTSTATSRVCLHSSSVLNLRCRHRRGSQRRRRKRPS